MSFDRGNEVPFTENSGNQGYFEEKIIVVKLRRKSNMYLKT